MKQLFAFVIMALFPLSGFAQTTAEDPEPLIITATDDVTLDDFMWVARPLIIFADSPKDPRFKQQMAFIEARLDDLRARDVVVITDTDPAAESPIRQRLRPRGFGLVLVAKDGTILLRKPKPWTVREISRSIDKLPARQEEVRERRDTGAQ